MQTFLQLKGKHSDKYALIDADDFDRANQFNWYFRNDGYVATTFNKKTLYLHRFIVNTPKGMSTDHLNRDKLDNRKINLLICDHFTNMQNLSIRKGHRGCVKKLPVNGHVYYYGELRKFHVRYQTTTCENEEQAKGALKQMIKERGL